MNVPLTKERSSEEAYNYLVNAVYITGFSISVSSPTCCNQVSTLSSLPEGKFLDGSKLKQIADDILKCIYSENEVPCRVENIVRKGEIACYKQFLLFSQYFPQLYILNASKCCIV